MGRNVAYASSTQDGHRALSSRRPACRARRRCRRADRGARGARFLLDGAYGTRADAIEEAARQAGRAALAIIAGRSALA